MNRVACVGLLLAVFRTIACPVGGAHALDPFCGLVVTENVTFTSDHSCSGNGLIVAEDKVTIDLAGFTLSGDGGPADTGIAIGGHTGVTIKNGTVRGFGDGIVTVDSLTSRATKLKLTGVTVRDNADYGALLVADGVVIAKSAFIGNGFVGLIIQSTKAKVTESTILANGSTGIEAFFGSTVAFSKLVVAKNLLRGVAFTGAQAGSLRDSTVTQNGGNGVYVGSSNAAVSKNTIAGNRLHGIYLEGEVGTSTVGGNVVGGNGGSGIYIDNVFV